MSFPGRHIFAQLPPKTAVKIKHAFQLFHTGRLKYHNLLGMWQIGIVLREESVDQARGIGFYLLLRQCLHVPHGGTRQPHEERVRPVRDRVQAQGTPGPVSLGLGLCVVGRIFVKKGESLEIITGPPRLLVSAKYYSPYFLNFLANFCLTSKISSQQSQNQQIRSP